MVGRKVKHPYLYRPTKDGWEQWQQAPLSLLGSGNLDDLVIGKDAYLAIPARLVICAPLWLPKADRAMAKEMASVELDIRGLIPKQGGAALTVREIETVGERLLVCAQIFPISPPAAFAHPAFAQFNASVLFATLDPDCLHLWQEAEDIVAVFTRGDQVVYWETAPQKSNEKELFSWLERMGLSLMEEGIVSSEIDFKNFLPRFQPAPLYCRKTLATDLPHPAVCEKLPVCEWKPDQRRAWESSAKKRKNLLRLAVGVGAIYLSLLAAFGGWIAWQRWQIIRVTEEVAAVEPQARRLQVSGRQWNVLSSTVEPSRFPLEVLHHLVAQMPEEGIRLTQFDFDDPTVGIQGEARSVTAASQFYSAISTYDKLAHIRWEMPPPALLPNNTARFVISGVLDHEKN